MSSLFPSPSPSVPAVTQDLHYELDEAAIEATAALERLRVFNDRSVVGAVSALAGIGMLTWVLGSSAGWPAALSWSALMLAVELAILLVGYGCRRALDGTGQPMVWLRAHIALAGICGVCWGLAAWLAWQDGHTQAYLATLAMLVGVAGISMMTMASYASASVLFFSGIYLTPLLHVVLYDNVLARYLLLGLLVGWGVQLGYTRELRRIMLRDVHYQVRNLALVKRLHDLLIHDPLTSAYSRRHTFDQMDKLIATRQRYGTSAAAIMFDIDHFKVINDQHGHPTGDRALREVVRVVQLQLRKDDQLGRVGGEEFLVLLPATGRAAALQLAERLRETVAAASVIDGDATLHLPASFGVAELRPVESASEWFRRVDGALYQAKASGRNRCVLAD